MKTTLQILVAVCGLAAVAALTSCTTQIDTTPAVGVTTTTTEAPAYYGGTTTRQRTITTRY